MNDSDIKVFKPQRKFNLPKLPMPKIGPKMLMAATVTLALLAVVTAGLLTRKQSSKQFVPQQIAAAATTITISDNFSGAVIDSTKWQIFTNGVGSTITQSAGNLVINIPQQTAQQFSSLGSIQNITGDFSANVDLVNLSTGDFGSAEFTFFGNGQLRARVSRYRNPTGERIESGFDTGTPVSVNLPVNTGNVSVRILRVGSAIQTFYNIGSGFILLATNNTGYQENGVFNLVSVVFAPQFPSTIANFDNFTAQVNLVAAPTPTPGTPAACTTQFTVLALAPTPTPTPTPSPTPLGASPTPTPTPTPVGASPTPTPTTTPATGCGFTCTNNVDCPSTMFCYVGVCRNPSCQTSASCVCSGTAPTPTPTPTPAPITKLTQAGSVLGTWTISLAGIIMVAFGALMLAF